MACPTPGREIDPRPFLLDLAGRPFRWGVTDCALVLADYWLWTARRNFDPAEHLRGRYDDEAGCIALLRAEGGLLRLVTRIARDIGAERLYGPDVPAGTCGIVRYGRPGTRETHYGAIRTPAGRWALKTWDGLLMTRDARTVAAWGV